MTAVAVLGGGGGALAAAVELGGAGHDVRLWSRRAETVAPFRAAGGVRHEGALGDGLAAVGFADDLEAALAGADVALLCLPAVAHAPVVERLAALRSDVPLVLVPGHTLGAAHAAATLRRLGAPAPPLAELSTLPYVVRRRGDSIRVTLVARRVRAAALPGGERALALAGELFGSVRAERDVLATSLANVNMVLHPPGAVLAAAWVEATGGDFAFYADGVTPGVARVIERLDGERLAVAAALGHELPPLAEEMAAIGTASPDAPSLRAAIAEGEANRSIRAPDGLDHRYYREDFGYGLAPLAELAAACGVEAPTAAALLELAEGLCGGGLAAAGVSLAEIGLGGLDADGLRRALGGATAVRP